MSFENPKRTADLIIEMVKLTNTCKQVTELGCGTCLKTSDFV